MKNLTSTNTCHKQEHKNRIVSIVTNPLRATVRFLARLTSQHPDQRNTLHHLNEHQLRDIGLTRELLDSKTNRSLSDLSMSAHPDIGFLQGGLYDQRRRRVRRLPRE